MNPQQTLDRYRHLVAVNNDRMVLQLSQKLQALPREHQAKLMVRDVRKAGCFWLFRDPVLPGKVMECVVSPAGMDSVTSLYMDCAELATIADLQRMRCDLIDAVAASVGLSVEAVGIDDPARGRPLSLPELSTAQLIDLLAERMGSSVVVPDSRGGSLDAAAAALEAV